MLNRKISNRKRIKSKRKIKKIENKNKNKTQ